MLYVALRDAKEQNTRLEDKNSRLADKLEKTEASLMKELTTSRNMCAEMALGICQGNYKIAKKYEINLQPPSLACLVSSLEVCSKIYNGIRNNNSFEWHLA